MSKSYWHNGHLKYKSFVFLFFAAKSIFRGLVCDVCNRSILRRPGKQGYECRDCQLKCHKQCHVRTPQACTNPTVLSMELWVPFYPVVLLLSKNKEKNSCFKNLPNICFFHYSVSNVIFFFCQIKLWVAFITPIRDRIWFIPFVASKFISVTRIQMIVNFLIAMDFIWF